MARDHGDVRWHRCLRCDCWVALPRPEHGTREHPPDRSEIELPLRGKALRDRIVLRLIAVDRVLHFLVLTLLGVAVLVFASDRDSLRAAYYRVLTAIQGGVAGGPVQSSGHVGIVRELDRLFTLRTGTLHTVGIALIAYGLLEGTEAIGLWKSKRWAEYLTFVSTTVAAPVRGLRDRDPADGAEGDRVPDQCRGRRLSAAAQAPVRAAGRLRRRRGRATTGVRLGRDRTRHRRRPVVGRAGCGELVSTPARTSTSSEDAVEQELRRVGAELWQAFPSSSRHPVKALDARAMEMASSDRELRAALFRFVDVVPACRSLDDLARHLAGFLDEVPETPPPLSAAIKISHTKAGRAALGAAAAGGVRHLAHRFIVGETPNAALATLRGLWDHGVASSVDLLGEATVTEAEADRYAARCSEAIEQLAPATRPLATAGGARVRQQRAAPARERVREDLGADPVAEARRAGARPARRGRPAAPVACARHSARGRTCTSTWNHWTRARRCSSSYSSCSTRRSFATVPRPAWSCRRICATRPIRRPR